jgi:hypothetical protein
MTRAGVLFFGDRLALWGAAPLHEINRKWTVLAMAMAMEASPMITNVERSQPKA